MARRDEASRDLMILALPWQRYDTTAIQLGALKAWLVREGYSVDTRHFYKDLIHYMSPATYMKVFEAYMGESAFAALLFPERRERIEAAVRATVDFDLADGPAAPAEPLKHPQLNANLSYAEREQLRKAAEASRGGARAPLDFDELLTGLETFLDDVFDAVRWEDYKVLAFTTSHQQFIPTVLLSRRIKQRCPDLPIVIGGALMVRELPETVLGMYECFDVVVAGEGERTMTDVMAVLTGREPERSLADVAGIAWRSADGVRTNPQQGGLEDLDELPVPDYDDYFRHPLRGDGLDVMPKLTVEASRACVWGRCTYCNLNLQWNNVYRRKSHDRVARELAELRSRYQSPFFTFCDTNVEDKMDLFRELARHHGDYRILAEVTPNISRSGMRALRDGGVRTIQVGIESFSERVLKLYRRNHRVLRSLEVLKWAAEFDVEIYYNLIINFPAEEPADVERSLQVARYARYFNYPAIHDYSFTIDSPAFHDMGAYNIAGWRLPEDVTEVYPPEVAEPLAQLLALTVHPIPAEPTGVDWSPLLALVDEWKRSYHGNLGRPGLVYCDGGDFLAVTVRRGGEGNDVVMTLPDEHRAVYLACVDQARSVPQIAAAVDGAIPERLVEDVLEELVDLQIAFGERGKYFALAVPERHVGNYPVSEPLPTEEPALTAEPAAQRTRRIHQRRPARAT